MPYYLSTAIIPSPRGRGTQPFGSDIAGANWIYLAGGSLLWRPAPLSDASLTLLADDKGEIAAAVVRNRLRNLVGDNRTFDAGMTFQEIVANLLVQQPADGRWQQLMPSWKRQRYEILLGPDPGKLFWSQPAVVPRASVTYTDSFNTADRDLTGWNDGDFTWAQVSGGEWEIRSNEAWCFNATATSRSIERTDTDVDTDNYYVQASITNFTRASGSDLTVGLILRGNAFVYATDPGIAADMYVSSGNAIGNGLYNLQTEATLDDDLVTDPAASLPKLMRLEADTGGGGTATVFWGGAEIMSATSVTAGATGSGNRKAAITCYSGDNTNDVALDSFETGDLAAGGAAAGKFMIGDLSGIGSPGRFFKDQLQ